MLIFVIVKSGKKIKTLRAKSMDTIFKNFQKYAKEKGFVDCIYSNDSFGNTAWKNPHGEVLLLLPEN